MSDKIVLESNIIKSLILREVTTLRLDLINYMWSSTRLRKSLLTELDISQGNKLLIENFNKTSCWKPILIYTVTKCDNKLELERKELAKAR